MDDYESSRGARGEREGEHRYTWREASLDASQNYTPSVLPKSPKPIPPPDKLSGDYYDPSVRERIKQMQVGRIPSHIARLLSEGRSDAERAFGNAFIDHHGSEMVDSINDIEVQGENGYGYKRFPVINGEGEDTMMWWTFAPYLYQALVRSENGRPSLQPEEALRTVIAWALTGDNKGGVSLEGLKDVRGVYVLGSDPEGASHKFTQQEARRMVEEGVFAKERKGDVQGEEDEQVEEEKPEVKERIDAQSTESIPEEVDEDALKEEQKRFEAKIMIGDLDDVTLTMLDRYLTIGLQLNDLYDARMRERHPDRYERQRVRDVSTDPLLAPRAYMKEALEGSEEEKAEFCRKKGREYAHAAEVLKDIPESAAARRRWSEHWHHLANFIDMGYVY